MRNAKQNVMTRFFWLAGISMLIFCWGLSPEFVQHSYSGGIYTYIAIALRWVSAIFPFAIGDILYLCLIGYILHLLLRFFLRIWKQGWSKTDKYAVPFGAANCLLVLYIAFKLLWGLNYSRPSIAKQLEISDDKYDVKQLVLLGDYFVDKLNILQPKADSALSYSTVVLKQKAVTAYQKMEHQNPFFSYRAPSVKPVISAWIISKIGIEGYYNPLSGEANVNMKLPAWVLPFVTCHEIAHQLGVAREDEANLVGYLTSANSDDINFQYSANYNMLRYILLEIRIKAPEEYTRLYKKIDPGILAYFKAENDFWAKYNGQMASYMGVAFDKFLKFNNQKSGIKSYQNIVIWLWNIHRYELVS